VQAEQDHHGCRQQSEAAGNGCRQSQDRANGADGSPKQRVRDEATCIEIDERHKPLLVAQTLIRLVVFGGQRHHQPTGDSEAARYRGHDTDDKDESITHLVADAEALRQEVKVLQGERKCSQYDEGSRDLGHIAHARPVRSRRIGAYGISVWGHHILQRFERERVLECDDRAPFRV
jgi:hypothetical protein